jgi:hypothetical protein
VNTGRSCAHQRSCKGCAEAAAPTECQVQRFRDRDRVPGSVYDLGATVNTGRSCARQRSCKGCAEAAAPTECQVQRFPDRDRVPGSVSKRDGIGVVGVGSGMRGGSALRTCATKHKVTRDEPACSMDDSNSGWASNAIPVNRPCQRVFGRGFCQFTQEDAAGLWLFWVWRSRNSVSVCGKPCRWS